MGIVGKDGAGKTTILKIMMGIIKPTSGTVEVEGLSPYSKRRKHVNNIGFVGVKTGQFKWEDSLFETLSLLKKIYNIPNDKYNDNLEIYNNFLQLEEFGHYPIKKLDYNQRICCQIVTALIHDPKIFLGDEILEGLNPVFKSKVIDLLKYLNKEKKCTIICTAKEIEDVTGICNRIILVNQGKIVDDYYNN